MSRADDAQFDEETFECADAGMADTFPKAAADLKRGDLVAIRGRPCRVVDNDVVKNGKHGGVKATIQGEDIFTGKRFDLVAPGSYGLPCPFLTKGEYQLLDIADAETGALSLLDDANEVRDDLNLPLKDNEALARAIRAHFDAGRALVLVAHKALGVEAIVAFKYDSHGR